jgi:hypothetical protein
MKKAIFSLAIALLITRFIFINPTSTYIGDGGDNFEFLGFMYIAKTNIENGKFPFTYTDIYRYPIGFDFSSGFDGPLAILSGAFLLSFLQPTLAYNTVVVLLLFLNLLFSLIFFEKSIKLLHQKGHNPFIPYISSLIFGCSPYVVARLGAHLSLAFVGGFPVLLYALIRFYKKSETRDLTTLDFLIFFSSFLLIAFGSVQYLVLLALLFPFIALGATIKYEKGFKLNIGTMEAVRNTVLCFKERKVWHGFIISLLIFISAFLLVYFGYFRAIVTHSSGFHNWFGKANIMDLFIPGIYLGRWWEYITPFVKREFNIEYVVTTGALETALLIFAFVEGKNSLWKSVTIAVLVIYVPASLGLIALPLVPEGGRAVVLASLLLALYLIIENKSTGKYVSLIFIFLLILERFFFQIPVSSIPSQEAMFKVKTLDGTAVLNIPLGTLSNYAARQSATVVFHGKKLMDGYTNLASSNSKNLSVIFSEPFSRFVCDNEAKNNALLLDYKIPPEKSSQEINAFMNQFNVKSIIVYKDVLRNNDCGAVNNWWHWFKNYNANTVISIYADEGIEIYQLK